jgi:hypothetical protein
MNRWTMVLIPLLAALAGPAPAQETNQHRPVRDVLIAETKGDVGKFLGFMKRIEGVNRRLQLGAELRVFRATFAGGQSGEIYVYWELPNFVRFAEVETKLHDDAEYRQILAEMDAAGQGFKSELLTIEITPR